ncbi:MAG: hypothetical protein JWR05_3690 [Mucilaginibacter sp.]|jgi:hypothetical protein|nr:hypothetical protein [Mucilaginibacter sp.]
MNPGTRNGGPPTGPAVTNAVIDPHDRQAQDATAIRVPAVFYLPSGRRMLAVLVVTACPFCTPGGPHVHRGNGGVRRAGCGRGEYVLVPRAAIGQRRGAA